MGQSEPPATQGDLDWPISSFIHSFESMFSASEKAWHPHKKAGFM